MSKGIREIAASGEDKIESLPIGETGYAGLDYPDSPVSKKTFSEPLPHQLKEFELNQETKDMIVDAFLDAVEASVRDPFVRQNISVAYDDFLAFKSLHEKEGASTSGEFLDFLDETVRNVDLNTKDGWEPSSLATLAGSILAQRLGFDPGVRPSYGDDRIPGDLDRDAYAGEYPYHGYGQDE